MNFTKKEIMEKICIASRLENLGLFIGSGFSKSVMEDSGRCSLSWLDLLKLLCREFEIKDNLFCEGYTYPLIASKIIEIVSENSIDVTEAENKVKRKIAMLVNDSPKIETIEKFRLYINELNAQWVITTNYDNLFEKIVGPSAYPILPNYMFYNIKNILPIYHIHGSILKPDSIVISNEDYAKTMRPSDYRHSRLPIFMKENTVLMIGYALGDLNVISAIDYRNNVFNSLATIENNIIQLVYTKNPKKDCYEKNGVIIYEFDNLLNFLEEFKDYQSRYKSLIGKTVNKINDKINEFVDEGDEYTRDFINNYSNYRYETIGFINKLDNSYCYIYTPYLSFLDRIFDKIYRDATTISYNFSAYSDYLNILIDLIKNVQIENVPTMYLSFLIHRLDEISKHVGEQKGQSFDAYDTWKYRKNEIPKDFIDLVQTSINEINYKLSVDRLLKLIETEETLAEN